MFTDRNVFNLIYKSKLLSYYVYGHVSSLKKTLRNCDGFLWKIALFTTNKSVYETEHWRESPRIVIYAYNESGHGRHRTIPNLVNGAYLQPFIFETVQLLIRLNVFIRLLTHRLTTVVVIVHGTWLSFHFRDTGNQHNHWLTNESKACILMAFSKSHNTTVEGRHLHDSNKNTKRSTSIATGCLKKMFPAWF